MYLNSISCIFVYRCEGEIGELSINEKEQVTLAFILDDILLIRYFTDGVNHAHVFR